ncbi:hypothetical protein ElyMa_003127200 [Elysia marginata]|uniref:Uncharacterized protein n=1 Tax=Elysia marginata TaxID=1093978 RepID=A0AAV4ISD5_9GAST|nr:hypothetical protein ElyMa_003127200 [Elysia marginata]
MRCIICIHWLELISNTDLWERTQQQPIKVELRRRKWRAHFKETKAVHYKAQLGMEPTWPQSQRKAKNHVRGKQKAEMASVEKTWKQLEQIAQERMVRRTLVGGLCFSGS